MIPDAVIFDMDGLLLDTERLALKAFREACAEVGVEADEAVYRRCIGTNPAATERILREGFGPQFPLSEVHALWDEKYAAEALGRPVPLKQGAEDLLDWLAGRGTAMAVATSTVHALATAKLANVDLLRHFRFVVAGDQVSSGKPDPEIYSTAVQWLGLDAGRCLALEDSDNGVRSARGAGLTVIQVPDMVPPSDDVLAFGHAVMGSLYDVASYLGRGA